MTDAAPYWLNDDSRAFLSKGYLLPGQTAEERIVEIADAAEAILREMALKKAVERSLPVALPAILEGYAAKVVRYMHKGWISLSSPCWSNFATGRGLPISCNNSLFDDTTESILEKVAEIGMMTKLGAGTSAFLGLLRERGANISGGGKSNGPVHFMELIQAHVGVISQSNVRRGNCGVYLPVDHPDIMEFLECREEGHVIQHLSLGVTISDAWMISMLDGDKAKRKIWGRIIRKRTETGYPYIVWSDTVNNAAPKAYKDLKLPIRGSNLCSEIYLASTFTQSYVCCLSSLNLLHYDEWKDTDLVEVMTYFLDAVMEEYARKTAGIPLMRNAHEFAVQQRALGLGVLGWHSYLQSKMIPFESFDARRLNVEIHRLIDQKSLAASQEMAAAFGEPPMLEGYGVRNMTRMAIAPTTSSSFILGQVSPSIEPLDSNYFTKDLQKGKFAYVNPALKKLLKDKGRDQRDVWRSILTHGGSVQHLDFLSDHEKAVFRTFSEISPEEVITQAAHRQKFIDQGQSLNLKIHHSAKPKEVSDLYVKAWQLGVKSVYYQRGTNPAQEHVRSLMNCAACEA